MGFKSRTCFLIGGLASLVLVAGAADEKYVPSDSEKAIIDDFKALNDEMRDNMNAQGEYRLVLKGNDFYLDGIKFNDGEVTRFGPLLGTALTVRKEDSRDPQCSAGTFTHRVTINGKAKSESGCLDDPRFETLSHAFRTMRENRSVITEKR